MSTPAPSTQDHAFEVLQALHAYNGWIASLVRPWARGRMLDLGAGIGNLTAHFLDLPEILAADFDAAYLAELTRRHGTTPGLTTAVLDITAPADPLGDRVFDTVLCVNVLEHLEDHLGVLRRVHAHLAPGGHLLLLVPAHAWLYGGVDREAGHVRRYRKADLRDALTGTGFAIERLRYFNMLGALGWWVNIRLLRSRYLPRYQTRLMEWLVPVLRLENLVSPPFGLSLIAVARKP